MNLRSEGISRIVILITCVAALAMGIFVASVAMNTYEINLTQKVILFVFWMIGTAVPFIIWKALCWVQDGFKQNT